MEAIGIEVVWIQLNHGKEPGRMGLWWTVSLRLLKTVFGQDGHLGPPARHPVEVVSNPGVERFLKGHTMVERNAKADMEKDFQMRINFME